MTAKEKLCALADAIREKTGETGLLTLDKMTELVSALGAGSEIVLPEGWAMGEFMVTDETTSGSFYIEHGLGAIPNCILIWSTSDTFTANTWRMIMKINFGSVYNEDEGRYEPADFNSYGIRDTSSGTVNQASSSLYVDSEVHFVTPSNPRVAFLPGVTYKWVAIVEEALNEIL